MVVGAALGGVIVGEEAGRAAAAGAGSGGGVGGAAGEAEAGVGLLAAPGGLVEDGAVDFGVDDVVGEAEIETGVGAEGEGGEFRLGEEAEIDDWEGGELEEVVGRGIDGRRRHLGGEPDEMRRRNTKSVLQYQFIGVGERLSTLSGSFWEPYTCPVARSGRSCPCGPELDIVYSKMGMRLVFPTTDRKLLLTHPSLLPTVKFFEVKFTHT